ncbi:MAG: C39 family peptidase [Leptospiraceae bacterium]|nr:C39 family peptidase [Leptospiraceae bacterium]
MSPSIEPSSIGFSPEPGHLAPPRHIQLPVAMLAQPDDSTCGPTCLHAVYQYYGLQLNLEQVISDVIGLEQGGTLAVMLGIDALKRGLSAHIYTYNLRVFDPSWSELNSIALIDKLNRQLAFKTDTKIETASQAYIEFLQRGGRILFNELSPALLRSYLSRKIPVLTGLSATYLYNCMREYTNVDNQCLYDDLRGEAEGHFVVLAGLDEKMRQVIVADPYKENSISGDHYYRVDMRRLMHSIMLGILTYDANLLVIEAPGLEERSPAACPESDRGHPQIDTQFD